MREWLSRDAWAAAVAKGEAPEAGLRKAYVAEVERAPADDAGPTQQRPTYRFTISTATPDRERDVVAVDGWKLKHYRANPVVLWAHDYRTPPVGQAVELPKVRDGKLVSGVRFDSDVHDLARVVEQLVERGSLRATSVGFAPLKHQLNDERRGYDFLEQELLEWSIVPVPANPEALAEAKAAGVDLAPVRLWAVRALEDEQGPGFWVSRATLEATWRETRPDVTISLPAPQPLQLAKPPDCPMGDQCPMRGDGKSAPTPDALATRVVDGEVRFFLDDEDDTRPAADELAIEPAALRAVLAELVAEGVTATLCRLTGRVD